jgi:hypothetical protein
VGAKHLRASSPSSFKQLWYYSYYLEGLASRGKIFPQNVVAGYELDNGFPILLAATSKHLDSKLRRPKFFKLPQCVLDIFINKFGMI